MSHLALRRVMIRLLHDPRLVAALYAGHEDALADVDLTAAERAWLLAAPPAAWRTDPARPVRLVAALAEEYPATVARATAHAAEFLRSPHFHRAVQERGSLALAFGDHLASGTDPDVVALARLERAIAAVRRAPRAPAPSPAGRLRLSPRAVVLRLPRGTLDLLAAARRGESGGSLGDGEEAALVAAAPGATEVEIEGLEPELAALLERAAGAGATRRAPRRGRRLGADAGAEVAIVDRLVVDGMLL